MSDLMQTFPVKKVIEHSATVKSFYFEQPFSAQPGQFVNLWIPGVDEKPFSVSALRGGLLEISVKQYGPFTHALMNKKAGDYLGLRGPFGRGFSLQDNALLIGGGIGMAPLRFLADRLHAAGLAFTSLLGAVSEREIIFARDFENISKCYFTTDDGSKGRQGLIVDPLREILEKESIEFIYAAGPEIMFVAVRKIAEELNLPYEFCMERYMKCGIGICGQCVLDDSGIRVCKEGPVLNQHDLQNVTELGQVHRDATGRRRRKGL